MTRIKTKRVTQWIPASMKCFFAAALLMMLCGAVFADKTDAFEEAHARREQFRDELMDAILADENRSPVVYALAALYTGKDLPGGNQALRKQLAEIAGKDAKFSPDEAGAESVKWQMRGWVRVYYLFNSKSPYFVGRLEPDVEAQLQEMFFQYGYARSKVARAQPQHIWQIDGSENHGMMGNSNTYLALQAVEDLEGYKDRKLPDGHTPSEHVAAWHDYYNLYCLERAKKGLFVEISPIYGKWFAGELFNMWQFSKDERVKRNMKNLLDLTWADWAVDQLNGTRGGAKTRCYQGVYSQNADTDSWDYLARGLFGIEGTRTTNHSILSYMALLTSDYRPADVVMDLALNKEDFEPFVYQSRRPGSAARNTKKIGSHRIYYMSSRDLLRTSFCTAESILGSWMLNTRTSYAEIHAQNRWQGVIFPTYRNARVYPQSVPNRKWNTSNQHMAAHHRNVMLVANHPKGGAGAMRVFYAKDLRDRVVEKDGWVILKEGQAWLGVRPLTPEDADGQYVFKEAGNDKKWDSLGFYLCPKDGNAPVVFVTSREILHKTMDDFHSYLSSHTFSMNGGQVTYRCKDDLGAETVLELGGALNVPRINGKPVDLNPKKVFDSPYLNSEHGSGVVTIQKDNRELVLDFTIEDGQITETMLEE